MTDWGDGAYEAFSDRLIPAAMRVAEIAAPQAGERVVDLGAGDGNLTLWLARTEANVVAVEPSARLLELAAARCARAGVTIEPHVGAAEALPLPDGSVDCIASNFALIFTDAPRQAARELLRVLRPGGRIVYSAWLPEGGIAESSRIMRAALEARGITRESAEPPLDWADPKRSLADLIPGGADAITVHRGVVDFLAESGAAWNAQQSETHPMWRAARRAIDDEVAWAALMAECSAALDAHSTLPEAMFVPSPYVVVEIHPRS